MRTLAPLLAVCALAAPALSGPHRLPVPEVYFGDDHSRYFDWLHNLSQDDQLRVSEFCSAHPRDYQARCGDIGPLHVPQPPKPDPCKGMLPLPHDANGKEIPYHEPTRAEWRAKLSDEQKKYVDQKCRGGRGYGSDLCGPYKVERCETPLAVSFDDAPVAYSQGARFAFSPGAPTATDWPTAATPWIALDRDGDGAITSGAELFGSSSVLPGGTTATNGFEALAALDGNGDGVIDARDPAFASLVLWFDRDRDGVGRGDELEPLARSVVAISLAAKADARCDVRGNCEGPRARITWRDLTGVHTGTVVDVYLPAR
ncbi:MAG TPA: hypothetical protein VMJ10_29970 [Kofleriaceae bacterium]|nr:hypothetical protein [Kofleriaceae bacterium]